jgi:hypothetical protein
MLTLWIADDQPSQPEPAADPLATLTDEQKAALLELLQA